MRACLLLLGIALVACASAQHGETAPEPAGPNEAGPAKAAAPAEAPPPMTGSLPGDRIPEFRATVRRPGGGEEGFDSLSAKRPTVYIVNSTTCPYCAEYVDRMKAIEVTYMAKGVDVVHVYPNRAEPPEEKKAWHAEKGFKGGQILDSDASIAHLLTADRTPTVYLVDAKGLILYRGAIDDAYLGDGTPFLANAIDAHLAGKPIEVTSTEPAG